MYLPLSHSYGYVFRFRPRPWKPINREPCGIIYSKTYIKILYKRLYMGIYYDGKVYGVGWELYDYENKTFIVKFEKTFTREMTEIDIRPIKDSYENLSDDVKNNEDFHVYVFSSCQSTYNLGSLPQISRYSAINKQQFEQYLTTGYTDAIV